MVSIAIYGIHGLLAKDTINAFLSEPFVSKVTFPLKLVTSDTSNKPIESDKLQYINYKDVPFEDAFKGVDVVINLSNPGNSPIQDVLDAVITNSVKLYIPSQFGTDLEAVQADFPGFLSLKTKHSDAARSKGIKTVDIYTGLFIGADQKFSGRDFGVLKYDASKNSVELIGGENTLINPSFFVDIGKSIASVTTFGNYEQLPDQVRIYSDRVSLGDLIDHYEKVHQTKVTRTIRPSEDIISDAKGKYKNFSFADFGLYLQTFIAQGEGKGILFEKDNHRELINPRESLFRWTKYVI